MTFIGIIGCRRWVMLLCVVIIASSRCHGANAGDQAQFDPAAEKIFQQAVLEYGRAEYAGASLLFDSLLHFPTIHQRTTAAYLMEAKSLIGLNLFDSSVTILRHLEERFPSTGYADDIRFTLGVDYMMLQQHRVAADHLLWVLNTSPDTSLRRKSEELFRYLLRERLEFPEISSLLPVARTEEAKDLIALSMVHHYTLTGDQHAGQALVAERLRTDSLSKYHAEILNLRKDFHSSRRIRIGVMLPLMASSTPNSYQQLSGEMLDGMDFALKEFTSQEPSMSITMDVRDVEMDSLLVLHAVQEWSQAPDVLCVIGPLFSSLVSVAAPVANRNHLPLLTPTATTNGLTASGSYVFQANPDYRTRGRAIAQYAVQDMGYKTFAVLATTEPMGTSEEGFCEEVAALGGKVVSVQKFQPGVTTIKEQCIAIRTAILGNTDDTENFDVPVNVDGVYIAIDDAEEIGVLISQMQYFNIKGGLLGNNEWYDRPHLDSQRKLVDGISFCSDSYVEDKSPRLEKYRSALKKMTQKEPTKFTFIGYDVMNVILSRLSKGETTREELRTALNNVQGYQGLHSPITFSSERVNSNLFLLQYRHGEIFKIADLGGP